MYGGLGDFFYNLKGDEDNPKTLADLYWGNITGKDQVRENLDPLMTWDNNYVFKTWFSASSNALWDTFRAVPCIYDDGIMVKDKTIVPPSQGIFPATGSHEEEEPVPEPYVAANGNQGILVESDENTCYGKQDFRSDLMPLGIKYRSIIETICQPENNGGYTVELDPNFFNETNPYWTQMFLLKALPTLDYDYTVHSDEYAGFTASLIRVGNYYGGSNQASKEGLLEPIGPFGPWNTYNGGFALAEASTTVFQNMLSFSITPLLHVSHSGQYLRSNGDGVININAKAYSSGPLSIFLKATNLESNQSLVLASKTYEAETWFDHAAVGSDYFIAPEPLIGMAEIPKDWNRFKISLVLSNPRYNRDVTVTFKAKGPFIRVNKDFKGDFIAPSFRGLIPDTPNSYLNLTTDYSLNSAVFEDLNFLKKDLLGGTKSPFEYLIWYTKMFNLRFYLEPGSKKVSIYLPEDMIQQYDPVNIQDRVCYDKEYSKTRRIIDEGYLRFNLTPNKNDTVERYEDLNGDDLFDKTFPIKTVEKKTTKEYLTTDLKIGTKARNFSALNRRKGEGYTNLYGFNQGSPYQVSHVLTKEVEEDGMRKLETTYPQTEVYLNYVETLQKYDFLNLGDGPNDTVVMYSGLRDTPFKGHAAIISRTSVDMVRFAGGPCWLGGFTDSSPGITKHILGAAFTCVYKIPHYGLVPSTVNYDWGLTYDNIDFESIIATDNIYNKYLKNFIERVYSDPVQVECYVRLSSPDFRKLYWFDNAYWILTEVSNYNFRDEPVKCKFIRYDNA